MNGAIYGAIVFMLLQFFSMAIALTTQDVLATLAKSPEVKNLVSYVESHQTGAAPPQTAAPPTPASPVSATPATVAAAQATPASAAAQATPASAVSAPSTAAVPSSSTNQAGPSTSFPSTTDQSVFPATPSISPSTSTTPPTSSQNSSDTGSKTTTIVLPVCGAAIVLAGALFFVKRHKKGKGNSDIFESEKSLTDDSSSDHASIYSDQKHMKKFDVANSLGRNTVQTASTLDSRSNNQSDYVNSQYKGANWNTQYTAPETQLASPYSSTYTSNYPTEVRESLTEYSDSANNFNPLPAVQRLSHLSVSNIVSDGDAETVAANQSQFQSYYTNESRISGVSEYSEYSELSVYTEDTASSHQQEQQYSIYSESDLANDGIQYQ